MVPGYAVLCRAPWCRDIRAVPYRYVVPGICRAVPYRYVVPFFSVSPYVVPLSYSSETVGMLLVARETGRLCLFRHVGVVPYLPRYPYAPSVARRVWV